MASLRLGLRLMSAKLVRPEEKGQPDVEWCSRCSWLLCWVWRGHSTNLHTELGHKRNQLAICVWVLCAAHLTEKIDLKNKPKGLCAFRLRGLDEDLHSPHWLGRDGRLPDEGRVFSLAVELFDSGGGFAAQLDVPLGDPGGSFPVAITLDVSLALRLLCCCCWTSGLLLRLRAALSPLAPLVLHRHPSSVSLGLRNGTQIRLGQLEGWLSHEPSGERKELGKEEREIVKPGVVSSKTRWHHVGDWQIIKVKMSINDSLLTPDKPWRVAETIHKEDVRVKKAVGPSERSLTYSRRGPA